MKKKSDKKSSMESNKLNWSAKVQHVFINKHSMLLLSFGEKTGWHLKPSCEEKPTKSHCIVATCILSILLKDLILNLNYESSIKLYWLFRKDRGVTTLNCYICWLYRSDSEDKCPTDTWYYYYYYYSWGIQPWQFFSFCKFDL